MNQIPFYKMSGSGNDFIVIDNRDQRIDENGLAGFITRVCRRKMSVGADGFILIENSDKVDFKWRFYNADGSLAEMCGNGARCAARFAYVNEIAGKQLSFETEAGIISARVINGRVKVKMPDPADLKLDFDIAFKNGCLNVCSLNTGVPHVVIMQDQIESVDVVGQGREIRYHDDFAPAGTNVNFVCRRSDDEIAIRTYERGVEDETLACGTGSIAAALIASCKLDMASPIRVQAYSGEYLTIFFRSEDQRFHDIYMEGDARIIYHGELCSDAWK